MACLFDTKFSVLVETRPLHASQELKVKKISSNLDRQMKKMNGFFSKKESVNYLPNIADECNDAA